MNTVPWRPILRYTGLTWAWAAPMLALPVFVYPVVPGEPILGFLLPSALLLGVGLTLWRLPVASARALSAADGALVVTLGWIGAIAASAAAFMLTAGLPLTHAVFEATSGLTTTGLSVVDVERAHRRVLLFRSILEMWGGAGLAIVMISAVGGPPGTALAVAEGRSTALAPHVRHSARLVVGLVTAYTLLGTVALRLAGMSWFDAVNHSMAAISTGGFSTRGASIGAFDSFPVEAVTIALMLLGTTNLVLAWTALSGRPRALWESGELRLLALLVPTATLTLVLIGAHALPAPDRAVRVMVFETVSAISTTGFQTVLYPDWPSGAVLVMIALMLIGGGAGSTAGGLKLARVYLLGVAARDEVARSLRPVRAVNLPVVARPGGGKPLSADEVRATGVFAATYLSLYGAGAWFMVIHGVPVEDALFEMASTIGTVGLTIGVTSPSSPDAVLWMQCAGMLLGRLEVFVVFVAAARLLGGLRARMTVGARG